MIPRMRFLLITLIFAFSLPAFATSYYISEIHSPDMSFAESLRTLIGNSVENAGGQVSQSADSADYLLKTDVLRLGSAYVLTVTRFSKGAALNSSRQKAASVEELDDAADRAVRATILGTKTKSDLRVGEVKPREEHELRRRILSHNTTYLGFGPGTYANLGTRPLAYDVALGYNWEVTPQAQIKILADANLAGNRYYMLFAGLGLNYLFTDEANSPYVGGMLGYAFSGSSADHVTSLGGFAANLGLGWMFFRTSSTQFDLFAGYTMEFADNGLGLPGAYGIRVGILF